eukprot:772797-Pelagomonas_calceolata.AAC.3
MPLKCGASPCQAYHWRKFTPLLKVKPIGLIFEVQAGMQQQEQQQDRDVATGAATGQGCGNRSRNWGWRRQGPMPQLSSL